jgi:hypothetical protein
MSRNSRKRQLTCLQEGGNVIAKKTCLWRTDKGKICTNITTERCPNITTTERQTTFDEVRNKTHQLSTNTTSRTCNQ